MNLQAKHLAVIGAMLVALGTQLSGLEHGWRDAVTPGFVGGLIIQIGTTIAAIYVGAPTKPFDAEKMPDRRKPRDDDEPVAFV